LPAWLPTLIEHRCSVGERGGFFERLRRGTYLAHILEHVALELQSLAGTEVGFGRTRQASEDGVYKVAVEYADEEVGRAALEAARELCLAAVHDQPYDVAATIAGLKETVARNRPAPVVAAVLEAAQKRRIPARLVDACGLIALGQGASQRRILGTQTDRTSAVAAAIAYDQELTRSLLRSIGVPVPEGWPVSDAAGAWQGAQDLGLPVVLRPRYASGTGKVSTPLTSQQEVEAAFTLSAQEGWSAIIERLVPGNTYSLLLIGDRVVAATDLSTGQDVTDLVHAEVAARAAEAAGVVGLDVAGVDFVAISLAQSLEAQGGAIVAVYDKPGLPTARPIGDALVEHLFPALQTGRIPVVGVTGVNGKTTTTRLTAHILAQAYRPVGLACTEGILIDGRSIMYGDCSGPKSAKVVLQHPEPRAAVLETARGGILREGLGFDRCDVAIVTNIGEGDHLGTADIDTAEQLAWVKSTVVAAVSRTGSAVLNAADPLVVGMAGQCRGSIIYFARDPANPVIVEHRKTGGRAIFVRNNRIVLAEGDRETLLHPLDRVPVTHGGRVGFHVENALAATAAGWALGLPHDDLRAGLGTFIPGMDGAPARFNLLDVRGTTVVLDYGHNVSALARLIETLDQFSHQSRSIVYSAAGDRRNEDMVRQGEQLGDAFDQVILYEDTYLRGRPEGEIFSLFRQGLTGRKRVRKIQEIRGGIQAVDTALDGVRPGELLVIQPDLILDTVEHIRNRFGPGAREINLNEALSMAAPNVGAAPSVEPASELLEVRVGRLGKCVHVTRTVPRGKVLLRTWGEKVPERTRHSIQVDFHTHLLVPSPLLFLNHSCEPNCGLLIRRGVEEIELHALRRLEPDEELTLDYDTFEWEILFMDEPCLCDTPSCRGSIRGYKHLPRKVRESYGHYIAEHLRLMEAPAPKPAAAPVPAGS
jgi:cyanophycin synthetase